jgi:16S rRNA (cytidine1402-2'-O)-methyltransferase
MTSPGTLYLIPVPLGLESPANTLPDLTLITARRLRHFIVEHAKTARAHLKRMGFSAPLREIEFAELNEHTPPALLPMFLQPLLQGHDLGLMSEAGCPAVADPGAALVALAQDRGIRVAPLVGPSSLLLALMASGLDGQRFAFHGYLPAKAEERARAIRELEKESRARSQTQLFIETPYRNAQLHAALLQHAHPETRLCLAADLTLTSEFIQTRRIRDWRKTPRPDLERRPTVFLLLGA